jgi:hypothetical protein
VVRRDKAEGPLPPVARLLVRLTTAPWRGSPALTAPVAERLDALAASGWRIRRAGPRNYLLWRGWLRDTPATPLVVVPDVGPMRASAVLLGALVGADLDARGIVRAAEYGDDAPKTHLAEAALRRVETLLLGVGPSAW